MKFLEKDLEDVVMNLSESKMTELGLDFLSGDGYNSYRQVRIGNYGICDLIFAKRYVFSNGGSTLQINVVELKKEVISMSSFIQLHRYMAGIERYFDKQGIRHEIQGVLVGRKIEQNDFCYVSNFSDVKFYTYDYDWDGIKFYHRYGYYLADDGLTRRLTNG